MEEGEQEEEVGKIFTFVFLKQIFHFQVYDFFTFNRGLLSLILK